MKTAIVTDTNSGITVEEGRKSGIFVLPMPVIIEGKSYLEGVNITNEQLYQAMKFDKEVSSSQPSPGNVMDLWDDILNDGFDELVYIPMSRRTYSYYKRSMLSHTTSIFPMTDLMLKQSWA